MKIIRGILHDHCETGTEGTVWALQGFDHIDNTKQYPWSYQGLNEIETGDWLVIYNHEGEVVWGGVVQMEIPATHKDRYWNRGLPTNCDRDLWLNAFYGTYKGRNHRKTPYSGMLIKQVYKQIGK